MSLQGIEVEGREEIDQEDMDSGEVVERVEGDQVEQEGIPMNGDWDNEAVEDRTSSEPEPMGSESPLSQPSKYLCARCPICFGSQRGPSDQ